MKHSEITPDIVGRGIKSMSISDYVDVRDGNMDGYAPVFWKIMGEIPEEEGDGIAAFKQGHAIVTQRLTGAQRSLSPRTLVQYQNFTIPETVNKQNVEGLIYHRDIARVSFATIQISERSILTSKKRETNEVFLNDSHTFEDTAIAGLTHVLNGTMADRDTKKEMTRGLKETLQIIEGIRFEEISYVDAVIGIVLSKQSKYDT